jgi:hypothetical protein
MKTRKIKVTTKQLDRVIEDVRALPDEPIGDHLTDDDFIGYDMGTLTAEEVKQVDAHLASCSDCAMEMERLMEAWQVWRGEQGKQRLAALRKRLLASTDEPAPSWWDRLMEFLREPFVYRRLAVEFATSSPILWEAPDGVFARVIKKDREGDRDVLRVSYYSREMECEGAVIRMYAGEKHWDAPFALRPLDDDCLYTEVVIPCDELPEDTVLRAELVGEEPKQRHAV